MQAKERLLKIVGRIVEERKLATTTLQQNDRKQEGEECGGAPKDVVDVLLQDRSGAQGLPSDFITGNIIEMMIPGEETVPTAMTLAVKYLSDCPVALQQLRVRANIFASFFALDPTARISFWVFPFIYLIFFFLADQRHDRVYIIIGTKKFV